VTRKITKFVANLCYAIQPHQENLPVLKLGNLDARRDWGHAADYVGAMYLMMQQDAPDDYAHRPPANTQHPRVPHRAFGYVGLDGNPRRDRSPVDAPGLTCSCSAVMPQGPDQLGWTPHYSFKQWSPR